MGKYLCLFDRDMTTWNRDGATRNSYNASYYNYYATKQYGGIYGDIPATSLTVGNRYYAHIILSESNNKTTRVQVRMDVNTFNMGDTCSSSDDTRCSQCFDLASGDDFRFLFVQSTATSGWGNTNVKEAYLIDVTEDTEGMTLAEAKTWCDANIETSQVVDTVEELTEEYETSITNSIGYQSSITLSNTKSVTLTNSIGNQDSISFNINNNYEILNSIGYDNVITNYKTVLVSSTNSIGNNEEIDILKAINEIIEDSKGYEIEITYTLLATQDGTVTILNTIGEVNSISSLKATSNTIYNEYGEQNSVSSIKCIVKEFVSTIGYNHSLSEYKESIKSLINTIGFGISKTFTKAIDNKITNSLGIIQNITSFEGLPYYVKQKHQDIGYEDNTIKTQSIGRNKIDAIANIEEESISINKNNKITVIGRLR
jgi:hypothetical protein